MTERPDREDDAPTGLPADAPEDEPLGPAEDEPGDPGPERQPGIPDAGEPPTSA